MNRLPRTALLTAVWIVSGWSLAVPEARAQESTAPRASQHGSVTQTVNATDITVGYDRPVARGRDLFGGIIDWDAVWTPGANRATWIEFSTPVVFEGVAVDAGRYGIWMVPRESGAWEVVLVGEWDTHHSFFHFESEVARIAVAPVRAEHMEVLAFYFPLVGPYETELRMHWGTMALPLRVEVPR